MNEIAFGTVQAATGEGEKPMPAGTQRNPIAAERGSKGGKKGGKTRALRLSAEDRKELARLAAVIERQFEGGFAGLTTQQFSRIIIAYEPVWAIGTGRTATPETAAESHGYVRSLAGRKFGEGSASELRILYGGSVKPDNIKGLMAKEEIDGALVGGASLRLDSFSDIVNYPG